MAFLNELKGDLKEIIFPSTGNIVTCYSNKIVIIEGQKGIYDFGSEEIKVKGKKGLISVKGNNLKIEEIGKEQIIVRGNIFSVDMGEDK